MSMAIFAARHVTKVYRSGDVEVHALRGVDLELFEGETAVLLGPSGSGKSTLLNIMGGLDQATSGTVRFRDQEITTCLELVGLKQRMRHFPAQLSGGEQHTALGLLHASTD